MALSNFEKYKYTLLIVLLYNNHLFLLVCERLKSCNLLPKHELLLVVDDPSFNVPYHKTKSLGVGSGGATINGLLTIAERISAIEGYTVVL